MEQRERAAGVAAGIPACRRVGLPARRKRPHALPSVWKLSKRLSQTTPIRAARMPPSTSGRDA